MLSFYMDHHVPRPVTKGLRDRGVDVLTALDDGTARLDDEMLLVRATELGRLLVTHDKGFLKIAASWQDSGRDFAGIVFAFQDLTESRQEIEYMELVAHTMTADEMRNRVEYIPIH
jgi:hypothetical protein